MFLTHESNFFQLQTENFIRSILNIQQGHIMSIIINLVLCLDWQIILLLSSIQLQVSNIPM